MAERYALRLAVTLTIMGLFWALSAAGIVKGASGAVSWSAEQGTIAITGGSAGSVSGDVTLEYTITAASDSTVKFGLACDGTQISGTYGAHGERSIGSDSITWTSPAPCSGTLALVVGWSTTSSGSGTVTWNAPEPTPTPTATATATPTATPFDACGGSACVVVLSDEDRSRLDSLNDNVLFGVGLLVFLGSIVAVTAGLRR